MDSQCTDQVLSIYKGCAEFDTIIAPNTRGEKWEFQDQISTHTFWPDGTFEEKGRSYLGIKMHYIIIKTQ